LVCKIINLIIDEKKKEKKKRKQKKEKKKERKELPMNFWGKIDHVEQPFKRSYREHERTVAENCDIN
jgi:hypothetical protein